RSISVQHWADTHQHISYFCRYEYSVLGSLRGRTKNLQPDRFEQSHAHNVLASVAYSDVVEKDSFQFKAKPAVEIDIAYVDVARMDVNLVKIPDHESIIKEPERRPLPNAFALQSGFTHQLFHLLC